MYFHSVFTYVNLLPIIQLYPSYTIVNACIHNIFTWCIIYCANMDGIFNISVLFIVYFLNLLMLILFYYTLIMFNAFKLLIFIFFLWFSIFIQSDRSCQRDPYFVQFILEFYMKKKYLQYNRCCTFKLKLKGKGILFVDFYNIFNYLQQKYLSFIHTENHHMSL